MKQREKLQGLLTDIATKSSQVNELFDAADKRGDGVNTKEEIDQIKSLNKEIETLEQQAAEIKETEGIRDNNNNRLKNLNTPNYKVPHAAGGDGNGVGPDTGIKSLSDMVFGDEAFKAWQDVYQSRGHVSEKESVKSPLVELQAGLKTLLTGAGSTSAGPFVFPDFKPIVDQFYQRPLLVRDLITVGQTGSDTVEYVQITGVTNNAAPVAEATASSGSSGTKPESAMNAARQSTTVKTIAHWIPVTKRALADAPQLRTMIDNFLKYGLDEETEDQILSGDGTGENLLGVLNTPGTLSQPFDTDILTTTRKARTQIRVQGRTIPTAYVMNPMDWETFDLLKDNEGRYYYGGPSALGTPRLWGLPVVESEGMTQGTSVLANWKMAVLWDRMQSQISMTDSHLDFFIRNLIAILAELRAAFGVIRPKAFDVIDLTA